MTLPVSLEEAKAQLRILGDDGRDDEILGFIRDAAAWVENYTGHILEAKDVAEQFSAVPRRLILRAWPIESDAEPAVTYSGPLGSGTMAGTRLDVTRRPARLLPAAGSLWPLVDPAAVWTVSIRAGYKAPDDVPAAFKRAMLILIAAYDDDREGGDTLAKAEAAANRLCRSFKRHLL